MISSAEKRNILDKIYIRLLRHRKRAINFDWRKLPRSYELSAFNRHGGFLFAITFHLPVYWISQKKLISQARETLGIQED